MRQITLPDVDVQAVAYERYHHPDPCVQRHLEVLWLKHHGESHGRIATLAGCSRSTVHRALSAYLRGGLGSVRRLKAHGLPSDLDSRRLALEELFQERPPRSVKEARAVIEQHTGVRRGLTQVRRFLHRIGLRPRKTAAIPVPPKSSLDEHVKKQAAFLHEEMRPRLEEARQGRRQVYFVDAAHFVFATFLGVAWCWARRCIRAASGRKRYNGLGALSAVGHELIQVSNHSYVNAVSVCELLQAVAKASVPGVAITLVLDNARYQKCALVQGLAKQMGIELLYLPGYSPNLNLIERVWKFVKAQCLRSTYYSTYLEFHAAIQRCLDDLPTKHKAAMDSLLTLDFQTFENVSLMPA